MARRQEAYDAIVVGSGITGGWAAKELCEAGLRVLMLEAGREIVPSRDYTEHTPIWEFKYRGRGDRAWTSRNQPVQSLAGPVSETTSEWFVNDRENPYVQADGKPFLWIRGRHLGGRSIMWGRQSYRLGDLDFEANAKDGFGTDWPIRYARRSRASAGSPRDWPICPTAASCHPWSSAAPRPPCESASWRRTPGPGCSP